MSVYRSSRPEVLCKRLFLKGYSVYFKCIIVSNIITKFLCRYNAFAFCKQDMVKHHVHFCKYFKQRQKRMSVTPVINIMQVAISATF